MSLATVERLQDSHCGEECHQAVHHIAEVSAQKMQPRQFVGKQLLLDLG